eukprot:TRINITY_DN33746_c0_g1_i4.p1 TRINITY_DN33746_c0_g1~~TRINITY_DN33746_c0_g1_i4.p1  ORF type:complete len:497 (+),score=91.24 TRINITY_DN33746_c0_g1_i4:71-1561(+)
MTAFSSPGKNARRHSSAELHSLLRDGNPAEQQAADRKQWQSSLRSERRSSCSTTETASQFSPPPRKTENTAPRAVPARAGSASSQAGRQTAAPKAVQARKRLGHAVPAARSRQSSAGSLSSGSLSPSTPSRRPCGPRAAGPGVAVAADDRHTQQRHRTPPGSFAPAPSAKVQAADRASSDGWHLLYHSPQELDAADIPVAPHRRKVNNGIRLFAGCTNKSVVDEVCFGHDMDCSTVFKHFDHLNQDAAGIPANTENHEAVTSARRVYSALGMAKSLAGTIMYNRQTPDQAEANVLAKKLYSGRVGVPTMMRGVEKLEMNHARQKVGRRTYRDSPCTNSTVGELVFRQQQYDNPIFDNGHVIDNLNAAGAAVAVGCKSPPSGKASCDVATPRSARGRGEREGVASLVFGSGMRRSQSERPASSARSSRSSVEVTPSSSTSCRRSCGSQAASAGGNVTSAVLLGESNSGETPCRMYRRPLPGRQSPCAMKQILTGSDA